MDRAHQQFSCLAWVEFSTLACCDVVWVERCADLTISDGFNIAQAMGERIGR